MLDIPTKRLCDCPPKSLGCSSAKEWARAQIVVWKFYYEGRDVRNKTVHPAAFPISLPAKAISLFTHKGELVLDPFVGSGSTLVAAQDLERSAVGFDLKKKYVNHANGRMQSSNIFHPELRQLAIEDDCRNVKNWISPESVKLVVTSPPYANMLMAKKKNKSRLSRETPQLGRVEQYSRDPRDLGTMEIQDYETALREAFTAIFPLVLPGGQVLVNVSDLFLDGKRLLIHVSAINAVQAPGFKLKNIIIWDKTNLMNAIGIFGFPSNFLAMGAFEYLLHFEKQKA